MFHISCEQYQKCPAVKLQVLETNTHLFVTKSVTSPGSPDRGHGVGSAKLGEGPKQGSQLKSLEILQQNKSTPTNETNEETNFKSMQIQVRRIHSKKGLGELFDLE